MQGVGELKTVRLRQAFTPGATLLVLVAVGNVALWMVARPPGQPTGRYVGEICGAEALLLFSCTLVLATLFPAVERAFDGLDRVVMWHRRAATAGVILLAPHIVLATSSPDRYAHGCGPGFSQVPLLGLLMLSIWALAPSLRAARWPGPVRRLARASYERWLTFHRLTGLFVVAAVAHGALVDPALRDSTLLRSSYLTIGGIGIAAYAYRELFARFIVPIYDYTVADIRRPNDSTLEVSLEPVATRCHSIRASSCSSPSAAPPAGNDTHSRSRARRPTSGWRSRSRPSATTRAICTTRCSRELPRRPPVHSAALTTATEGRIRSGSPAASASLRS
jgi:hypothetical protein